MPELPALLIFWYGLGLSSLTQHCSIIPTARCGCTQNFLAQRSATMSRSATLQTE